MPSTGPPASNRARTRPGDEGGPVPEEDRAVSTAPTAATHAAPTAESVAADVEAAAERLHGVARSTPLEHSARLSAATGAQVWLKREDLQVGRSYKLRGAFNLLAQLGPAERAAGAVGASAGNHGQGVAHACRTLGIRGRVHVPSTTPRQKRERIQALGGDTVELVVGGDTYDEAAT